MHTACPVTCGTCGDSSVTPTHAPVVTASPTVKPTTEPTPSPTGCVDQIDWCETLVAAGHCYHLDRDRRKEMHLICTKSCDVCHGNTLIPSVSPTPRPTETPTPSPTDCQDTSVLCGEFHPLCNSGGAFITALEIQAICPVTCETCNGQTRTPTYVPSTAPSGHPS